jgi:hypothetical protein
VREESVPQRPIAHRKSSAPMGQHCSSTPTNRYGYGAGLSERRVLKFHAQQQAIARNRFTGP